ncbi:MAG TPA: hypothetical protein PKZ97_19835 [Azospirillaceae bacterium]|nr:hypothetical protein [Azospirillaceae bacterium]
MIYALLDAVDAVVRYQDFATSSPPQLAPAKGLRWVQVDDHLPPLAADEVLEGPVVTVETASVRRVWTAVLSPPPAVVSMAQARVAIERRGLTAAVSAAAAADAEAAIAWEYATEISRGSDLVAALAAALGLDDAALDDLFREAGRVRFRSRPIGL